MELASILIAICMNRQQHRLRMLPASRLNDTISGDLSSASDEELMDVCKDFEAYFVEQVMKEMKKMIPEDDNKDQSMGIN